MFIYCLFTVIYINIYIYNIASSMLISGYKSYVIMTDTQFIDIFVKTSFPAIMDLKDNSYGLINYAIFDNLMYENNKNNNYIINNVE